MSAYESLDLTNTIGGTTIGLVFGLTVGGIAIQQAFEYFRRFPEDRFLFKASVLVLAVLNLGHSASISHIVYTWNVVQWGNPLGLNAAPPSYGASFLISSVITAIVQAFYAYRIYILSKSWYLPALICLVAITQTVFSWICGIYTFIQPLQSEFHQMLWGAYSWFVLAVANDIVITVAILYYLQRSKGYFASTNSVINRISLLTLQTNSITAVSAAVVLILFATIQNGWNNGLYFVSAKLYIISFMASINARGSEFARNTQTPTYASRSAALFPDSDKSTRVINTTASAGSGSDHEQVKPEQSEYDSGVIVERSVVVDFDQADPEPASSHPYRFRRNGPGFNPQASQKQSKPSTEPST